MDSSKNYVSSGWCAFCRSSLSSLSGDATETNSVALQKHLSLIERYFQNSDKTEETLRIPGLGIIIKDCLIGTCENCGEVVKEFSKLYQEMKCIELKLNWKLETLKSIVKKAERKKPSKLKRESVKKMGRGATAKLEKAQLMDELLEFQNNFVQKCSFHFKQSYPKLTLKRYHHDHEQEAATVPVLESHHFIPADESSNGITDKSDRCNELGKRENIEEAQIKSPIQQRKRRSLNSVSKAKLNKRAPEFRIPELETLEMTNSASAPSIVLYGTKSGLEFDKSGNGMAPEKTVTFQSDAATSNTLNCGNESRTSAELTGNISRGQINIPSIVESIIRNILSEETETTATPAFQGDSPTCEYVSTSTLKFEEQPILFDDEENDKDSMSVDAADPLGDSQEDDVNNCNDGNAEQGNEAMTEMWTAIDGTPALGENDSHCDTEVYESETFLVKREHGNHTTTTPLNENVIETTSSSQTQAQLKIIVPTPVKNHDDDSMKEVAREKPSTLSGSVSNSMSEKESLSRFRRRFKCPQCTLTFTSATSLESHVTSAHVELDDPIDKDDINGKSESEQEIGDEDADAFSIKEDDEQDDTMISESDSEVDINEDGQQKIESLKSELDSSEYETDQSRSMKKKSSRGKEGDSESTRDLKCEKCEPWSNESGVPWHVHIAKHCYLHTNGQVPLGDENLEHLNIKWSDLKVEIDGDVAELKEEYTAPGCGRKFALEEDLVYHLRLHGSYKCAKANCKTMKICLMDLIEHELNHGATQTTVGYGPTECTRCKFQNDRSRSVLLHFLGAHSYEMIDCKSFEKYHCRICNFSFDIISGCFPMLHFLNFHDLSRIDDPSKVHRCEVPDCPAYFLTVRQLKAHHHHPKQTFHPHPIATKKSSSSKKKWKLRPKKMILANMRKAKITEDGLTVEDFVIKKGAEYKCDETSCNNAAFFTVEEMNIHRKLHGNFKCNFCETVENFAPNLCIHELEIHSGTADDSDTKDAYLIECPRKCPKRISGRPRYIAHHLGKHLDLESDTPRCLICGVLYFVGKKSLEAKIFTHFKEHHDLSTLESTGDDAVWRCKKENCKAYFLSRFQLSNHVQDMHCVKSKVKKIPCLECDKICESQNVFSKHMLKCHPEAFQKFFPISCPIDECLRRCETEKVLRRHMHMSHPKQSNQQLCPVCGKYFKLSWSLKAHIKSHDEEHQKRVQETKTKRNFVCDECGSKFKNTHALEKHKLAHSGPESWSFVCEICSRKCISKQKLEDHLRTHTKEKSFQCEHCGASYAHRHNWRIHVQKKHGLDITKVYTKVNERMKAKYVKNVRVADEGASTSQTKRKAPNRSRKDWEEEDESPATDSDFTD